MDALDLKILAELMRDSRISIISLAKKVRSSREVVNYRIHKLIEEKIILKYVTEIDTEKLGFHFASLFLSINVHKENDFKKFILQTDFTAWTSEFSGVWNFGVGIYGKDEEEIHERFLFIFEEFKKDIIAHRLVIHRKTQNFYEKYLGVENFSLSKKKKKTIVQLDVVDKILLKELSQNSRVDCVNLSKKVNLSAVAVANRIRNLENNGVIIRFSVFLDPSKLGLYQFSVFVNTEFDHSRNLIGYLELDRNVSFIVEYIGNPYVEFGVIVKDPYDFRKIIQNVEGNFPGTKVIESFMIQKEILSIGLPLCVFK